MKCLFTFLLAIGLALSGNAQYYFPPVHSAQWDTVNPSSLGWCSSELDTLYEYLESRNSKSFLILHKGRMVSEKYFNGHSQDSSWYWASAGKSLIAFLMGMAQEAGLLDISDRTSDYLGTGWTSAPAAKENLISLRHQLSMTTGLDYNVPDQNCLEDSCLKYLHDAGSYWYYHNAPYRLLQDVLEAASGKNINVFTYQSLATSTGISGFWLARIFFSKARNMARFGLLNLNNGVWDGQVILGDSTYNYDMKHTSQTHNPAYGYLWWLNGSSSFRQPGIDLSFPGMIIPTAPSDLYMAAGANDQRIYIVPSLDLVVVRQGDAAYSLQPALSSFDNELWSLIMNVICNPTALDEVKEASFEVFPNPASDFVYIRGELPMDSYQIIDASGKILRQGSEGVMDVRTLKSGVYFILVNSSGRQYCQKLLLNH